VLDFKAMLSKEPPSAFARAGGIASSGTQLAFQSLVFPDRLIKVFL